MYKTEVARTRIKQAKNSTAAHQFLAKDLRGYYLTYHPILNSDCVLQPSSNFLQKELWADYWWDAVKDLTIADFEFVHYIILMEEDNIQNFPLF